MNPNFLDPDCGLKQIARSLMSFSDTQVTEYRG